MATRSRRTASAARDYLRIADAYARAALADVARKHFNRWIRLAAQRYVDDRERARKKKPPFTFSTWHARDVCAFIEKLPHVEGNWKNADGSKQSNIVLAPAHVFFLVNLFGFRNHDGSRRFTSALFAVARKNAKSTLAAAVLLYCLSCEDEPGAQVISAATTGDQARVIFNIAKKMAQKCHALRAYFGIDVYANAVTRAREGAVFKPINAKASTQDGLNPSHVGLDEIHAHKSADLVNVLTSAAGARESPLWLYTTTEGYPNAGPWSDLRHFAKQILLGVLGTTADHFLVLFYGLDETDKNAEIEGDDDFDEAAWHKANPLLCVNSKLLAAIRKESVEARAMPSKLAEFKTKRLNKQSASADAWIDLTRWLRCGGAVDLAAMRGHPCWFGLDLASTRDLASLRMLWKIGRIYFTHGIRWVPKWAVAQRTERGTVPYASWVASGLIKQTDGDVVDYAVIERDVMEMYTMYNPAVIAYDPWNATDITNRLTAGGVRLLEFRQGTRSYHPAMQEMERSYINGDLRHGGDPCLAWCASNVVPHKDVNLNLMPDKKKSRDKIDDITALLMAFGVSLTEKGPPISVYASRGLLDVELQ